MTRQTIQVANDQQLMQSIIGPTGPIGPNGVAPYLMLSNFGTIDPTGTVDMTAIIQASWNTAYANFKAGSGSTVIVVPAGTFLCSSPLVPKSGITVLGGGVGVTHFLTDNATPLAQVAGTQCVHFNLSGITFKEKGSHPSATVFGFTALQGATLSHISFEGYYSGTLLDIEGAILTAPLDDPATQWHTSNSIFNLFDDWAADGCAIGVKFAGVYGSTPTASPPGSSNAPSLVITQNVLNNFILEGVTTKAFDFVKCSDTNYIRDAIVFVNTTGAVVVQIGDDNGGGASAGNNYVNNIYADVSVSMSAPATAVTFFKAGNWTFGNVFTGITDVAPAAVTAIALDTNVTQFKYIYRGANWATGNLDSLGFNTNYMNIAAGEYHFLDNGTAGNPILRFFNDAGNGMFLPKAGIFGFSKGISSGHGGGGTSGSLTINGGTTGSFVIAVDSTGKLPISDPHVLGQCWNNGGVVTISAG